MVFADEDKHFIKILCKEKRYSYRKFIREFPNRNWDFHGLDHLIKKIYKFNSIAQKSESGRPQTARHDDVFKGELNLYNKWQSDDLFHIVINENHPRGNRFWVILKILTFMF